MNRKKWRKKINIEYEWISWAYLCNFHIYFKISTYISNFSNIIIIMDTFHFDSDKIWKFLIQYAYT